jgi:predicted Zn-dependent protease
LLAAGEAAQAIPLLQKLRHNDESVVQYHTALGQAFSFNGDNEAALATFEQAMRLFPRNTPVTVRYADALVRANQPARAHEVLLDLFNAVAPTPEQARQLALAANAAGDVADAYHYMAEYHLMSGDLALAANQLQMALSVPKITDVQRARYRARLDEIRAAMPRRMRMQANDSGQNRRLQ